jgi:hypothetical protein
MERSAALLAALLEVRLPENARLVFGICLRLCVVLDTLISEKTSVSVLPRRLAQGLGFAVLRYGCSRLVARNGLHHA